MHELNTMFSLFITYTLKIKITLCIQIFDNLKVQY